MKVSDLMNVNVISVSEDDNIRSAARLMEKYDIGAVPVCGSDGRVLGMVTDRDIVMRCIAHGSDMDKAKVGDIMTRSVVSVSPDDDVQIASRIMSGEQIRRVPVTENERIVGILSLADIAHSDIYSMEAARALTGITETESAF